MILLGVAPRTGAWIETDQDPLCGEPPRVAPRTGAWIETGSITICTNFNNVAPRTGAWIETKRTSLNSAGNWMSHPARVRGLKQRFSI